MGVHYTDIFAYLLGGLERACGMSFIAEPGRVLGPGMVAAARWRSSRRGDAGDRRRLAARIFETAAAR